MDQYRHICHCGHDRATHYKDRDGVHGCLAQGCDECKKFIDEKPKPVKVKVRPAHASHCQCLACREATVLPAPRVDTIPMPSSVPPYPYGYP